MSLRYILLKLKDNVDFRTTIFGEKSEKNEKKIYRFNMVQQIAYINGNREENFHYISNQDYIKQYLY